MNLKKLLKLVKLNESSISTVLGIIVVFCVVLLAINFFRKANTNKNPKVSSTVSESQAKPGSLYQVKSGDSLWSIAQNAYSSGYNWIDIAEANNLVNPNMIEEGQSLTLPDVTPKEITQTGFEKVIETKDASGAISGATYTVVKGDNLWTIAVRAYGDGYKWVNIASENKLANPNLIHPGNVLTLAR